MPIKNIGGAVTQVDTSPKYPLGEVYIEAATTAANSEFENSGERWWVYVYNDEAATAFAEGNVITRDASTVTHDGVLAATTSVRFAVLGVAQHAIAAGSYGWILQKGLGEVLAGTETIDANEAVAVSATDAGTGMEAGAVTTDHHHRAFAYATEDAAAAALATCWINCVGS